MSSANPKNIEMEKFKKPFGSGHKEIARLEKFSDPETGDFFYLSHDRSISQLKVLFLKELRPDPKAKGQMKLTPLVKVFFMHQTPWQETYALDRLKGHYVHFENSTGWRCRQSLAVNSVWRELEPLKKNCFIFDLDGTLVFTQLDFHARAESEVLKTYAHVDWSPLEISKRFSGISTTEVFQTLAPKINAAALVREKWARMYQLAGLRTIYCLPEMYELVSTLYEQGSPIAIGSASPRQWINTCLKRARHIDGSAFMAKMFADHFASAEDCQSPKSAPDVFIAAKSRLLADQSIDDSYGVYVIGDGQADVSAALVMGAEVLYLSLSDESFDQNPKVKRFSNSDSLANHIMSELT